MNLNLTNKIALVTGGSRGIGAAICRGLAAEGVRVGVNYSASAEKAEAVAEAIRNMTARGAPAIGVAAAYGLALAAWQSPATDPADLRADITQAAALLRATRPTAVNLAWALDQVLRIADVPGLTVDKLRHRLLAEARRLAEEDQGTGRKVFL